MNVDAAQPMVVNWEGRSESGVLVNRFEPESPVGAVWTEWRVLSDPFELAPFSPVIAGGRLVFVGPSEGKPTEAKPAEGEPAVAGTEGILELKRDAAPVRAAAPAPKSAKRAKATAPPAPSTAEPAPPPAGTSYLSPGVYVTEQQAGATSGMQAIDVTLDGTFTVHQTVSLGANRQQIRGTWAGTATVGMIFTLNGELTERKNSHPMPLAIVAERDVSRGEVKIELTRPALPGLKLLVSTRWSGEPVLANATGTLVFEGQGGYTDPKTLDPSLEKPTGDPATWGATSGERVDYGYGKLAGLSQQFFLAGLQENPDVMRAGNALNTVARSAIDIIDAALPDQTFRQSHIPLLFPPPPPRSDEIVVNAKLDWVLFHRRRLKQCTTIDERPVARPPVRYRVFHLRADTAADAQQIRGQLLDPTPEVQLALRARLDRYAPHPVVEFAGEDETLTSNPQAVISDWQAFNPGTAFAYAAVATKGSANDALELLRLGELETLIDRSNVTDAAQVQNERLDDVPAALASTDVDGAIFALTITPPVQKYVRYQTYHLSMTDPARDAFGNLLVPGASVQEILKFAQGVPAPVLTDLGVAQFPESGPAENDVQSAPAFPSTPVPTVANFHDAVVYSRGSASGVGDWMARTEAIVHKVFPAIPASQLLEIQGIASEDLGTTDEAVVLLLGTQAQAQTQRLGRIVVYDRTTQTMILGTPPFPVTVSWNAIAVGPELTITAKSDGTMTLGTGAVDTLRNVQTSLNFPLFLYAVSSADASEPVADRQERAKRFAEALTAAGVIMNGSGQDVTGRADMPSDQAALFTSGVRDLYVLIRSDMGVTGVGIVP
jgi:hypothetical protein